MTAAREKRLREICARRQMDLAVILENVHDPHNISAVLRTCDAVGVQSVFVLYTETSLDFGRVHLGRKSSASARKWVDVYLYRDLNTCFNDVKQRYHRVLAAQAVPGSQSLYSSTLTEPTALLFGNEKDGVSPESLALADGALNIPQSGMVRSLNISVACAVVLYEAFRQRASKGFYDVDPDHMSDAQHALFQDFVKRQDQKYYGRTIEEE